MLKKYKIIDLILLIDVLGILLTLIFNSTIMSDELEHLRASFLVSEGYIPYRDFFEHHHPLLWYIFAPFIYVLPHHAVMIFYTAKIFALICSCLTYYILYLLIKKFWGGTKVFLYFTAISLIFYPLWYSVSIFKPDTFARLFYFIGLYFCLNYIRQRKTGDLVFCGLAFCVAFLFIQTVVFSILPLAVPLIWLFYRDAKFWKDAALASILPSVFLALIIAVMHYFKALTPYWQENVVFNAHLFGYCYTASASVIPFWLIHIGIGIAIACWFMKKQFSVYYGIIFWLFGCEILQHLYFPAIFPHYLVIMFMLLALLISPAAAQITDRTAYRYIIAFLGVSAILNLMTLGIKHNVDYMSAYKAVNTSPENNTLHINFNYVNIYAPQQTYYTLVPHHFAWLDNYLFNRFPEYNVNKLAQISGFTYLDYMPEKNRVPRAAMQERFVLSDDVLQLYEPVANGLYRRKDLHVGTSLMNYTPKREEHD